LDEKYRKIEGNSQNIAGNDRKFDEISMEFDKKYWGKWGKKA
jgi:hypothetical protein